jgi:phosphate transport system substrate-binding protein
MPILLAVVGAILYFGGAAENAASSSGSVQVVGSESMRPTVTACAEDFMTRTPQADVIVRGGGSGDGVAALLHGMIDIGMTSRELSQRERDYAGSKGFELATFALALDGVTVIVNGATPVATLDLDQLHDIFTGKIRNWSELGARDGEILPFARAAGSGTASLFGERVLRDEGYAPSVRYLPTNEAIVAEVAARPGAIGYAGLGALRGGGDRVKPVPLHADSQSAPVAATVEAISSKHYPLSRALLLVTAGPPSGTAKAFIDFCLSASGQALFQRAGYIAIKPLARQDRRAPGCEMHKTCGGPWSKFRSKPAPATRA